MIKNIFWSIVLCVPCTLLSQQTKVSGVVTDMESGEPIPFVKIQFLDTKIGTVTDEDGRYQIETYYASDSLIFTNPAYVMQMIRVKLDKEQEINIALKLKVSDIEELIVLPPDELPSVTMHKKIVRNKPINNRAKLLAYEYELYNKIQFDLNNIGEKFKEIGLVKNMKVILDYLDSTDNENQHLPMIFTETLSDFFYTKDPKRKKEVVKATRTVGLDKLDFDQFLGEMYMDINIYDNNIPLINKSFISPISNYARNHYYFLIVDSAYIDNQWCYKMTFRPKREGSLTFNGEMWIHDTTYAVKSIKANISPWANLNYIQDLYFEQHFNAVEKEVWMMTNEAIVADFKLTKKSNIYGLYARKYSYRKDFKINQPHPDSFYKSQDNVEVLDSAKLRDEPYWIKHRHVPLSYHQEGITEMADTLRKMAFFKFLQAGTHLITTGFYPIGKIEYGHLYKLFSFSPVEQFRFGVSLRTSTDFSKRIQIGGKVYYGILDKKIKYGGSILYNFANKKRTMLKVLYDNDIEQIGASTKSTQVGTMLGTLLRTGPLDKLTFVNKISVGLEKDIHKDFMIVGSTELKEYTALGFADFRKNKTETVPSIRTHEVALKIQWARGVEYVNGAFKRAVIKSRYPILSFTTTMGIKGVLGSQYEYQKYDFAVEQRFPAGRLGFIRYEITAGYINGIAAYPFLKVHEGNQSYYAYRDAFSMLNYYEFVSDKYVGAYLENHWGGLFLDHIPAIKRLRWRFVTSARATWGDISSRHQTAMLLPDFTHRFGDTPYVEFSGGIENILNLFRVDVFYRASYQIPGKSPFGLRVRWEIYL